MHDMTKFSRCLPAAFLLAGIATAYAGAGAPLSAQDPVQQAIRQATGQEVTPERVLQQLRASGMSREEARSRLSQAGYDPSLVDPYFDRLEGGQGTLANPGGTFLSALENVGILQAGTVSAPASPEMSGPDPAPAIPGQSTGSRAGVFGLDLFRRATDQFEPVLSGPVDDDYRLGPGDQIILIITGDVELAYTLEVTREGFIVVPDVGQLSINGLTLHGLRSRLYDRLGRVYSGVREGPDATTFFDVSLGRLRANQVFVIGDVERPGAYQISSVATVLNALYRGGGPTESGSFRTISVNRGGREVAEIDLYDYLLRGDASSDIRLEQGDVVFVPPVKVQVRMTGQIRRPGIYEMVPGETLRDAVRFAGGFEPEAHIQRIQVDRVLPPNEREPGRDRVLMDADVMALETGSGPEFPLEAGDEISVFGVLDRRAGRVTLRGEVWRPGEYEFSPGMTVWTLLEQASGLVPTAFRPAAHIRRLIPETGGTSLIRVSLETDAQGRGLEDLVLEDLDEVVVFSVDRLRPADSVQIQGQVKEPGFYPLDEGATVEDLILMAGGFTRRALPYEAEVARPESGLTRSETLATRFTVRVLDLPHPLGEEAYLGSPETGAGDALASQFELRNGDQVFIRGLPGDISPGFARVAGEVFFPGPYGFEVRQERLSTLVEKAGGLTPEAYAPGARLVRDSVLVGIHLENALERPGGRDDVFLMPGDELIVPPYEGTVLVSGAVAFDSRVLYREGEGLDYFLARAGGTLSEADLDRVNVLYPSGERGVARKFLFFRRFPEVQPGSTINVPRKVEGAGRDWDQMFTRTLSITTSLLTILVALDRLK